MDNQHRKANRYAIYMIRCAVNGKRYVGSASFLSQRLSRHRLDLRQGNHYNRQLQNSWDTHGEDSFEFVQLECVLRQDWLLEAEQRYLDELKPEFNVNSIATSRVGTKHSSQTRKRMSVARKEYCATHDTSFSITHRANIGKAQLGKTRFFSEAHKTMLSISATGRKLSEETRKKISEAHTGKKRVFSDTHRANIKAAWDRRKLKEIPSG